MSQLLDLTKELCVLRGVSSFEDPVREFIRAKAEPYADELHTDSIGNLIVFKKGKKATGRKLLLAAHMDEVGLIITNITEEGYLKFSSVGNLDRRVLLGKPVQVGAKGIPGVIGLKAIHLVTQEERKSVPKLDEFYIDIGAKDQEDAQSMVQLGDCACFVGDAVNFGDNCIKAKALDDRIGCAALLLLLQEELPCDVTFVFTAQNEVGARGALAAAFSVTPEIALLLETTTAADLAGAPAHKQVCTLGNGPVIVFMDSGAIADKGLFDLARETAETNGIPWQTKHDISGGTDSRSFQRTKTGVRTLSISTAVRYLHAPASVANTQDMDHMLRLVRLLIAAVAKRG